MLIISIKTYEERFEKIEKLEKFEMFEAILDGLADVEEGKTKDGISVLKELKTKYDL